MKDQLTAKQLESTIAFFLVGSSLVTGSPTQAGQDTWFCMIVGFLLNIPILWVHSQIIEMYPGRNYFENIVKACGKPAGKAVCILLMLYSFFIASLVKKVFCNFIQTMNMPETPFIFILLSIVFVEFYMSKKRLYVVARVSKFTLPVLMCTVGLTIVLSFKDMDFSNLKPVLKTGFGPMANGILLSFTLPFGESILCAPLFGALDHKIKVFPVFLKGMLIGLGVNLFANLRNLLLLGSSASIFVYPSYEAVSVIAVGEFFTRVEVIIGFNLLLAGFIKVCVTYFTCCQEVSKILDLEDYVPLFAPCGLILVTMIMLVSSNTEEMMNWLHYHPYLSLPFQVLIPVVVLITGKIRNKMQKKKTTSAKAKQPKQVCANPSAAKSGSPEA
ncbi:MAG TPA: endospore germination permease [Caproicibacter sp.]|nr:endospore germination permease [Caproicibacter sp.]